MQVQKQSLLFGTEVYLIWKFFIRRQVYSEKCLNISSLIQYFKTSTRFHVTGASKQFKITSIPT